MLSFPLRNGRKTFTKTNRVACRRRQPGGNAHVVLGSCPDHLGVNVTVDRDRELGSGSTTRHLETILPR